MHDSVCFVQFIHPGGEHHPDDGSHKRWNTGNHKRKFLVQRGRYLQAEHVVEDDVLFWGEWEPESTVIRAYDHANSAEPRFLQAPYIVLPAADKPLQNTDPFVFGEQFFYTCCQQWANGRPTQLHALSAGSVILFGSCIARCSFAVDTVFVVERWLDVAADTLAAVRGQVPPIYYDATLARIGMDRSYRLYWGATIERPVHGMFSFVPCLPDRQQSRGFARPIIELLGIVTPTLSQGKRLNRDTSLADAAALWQHVRAQSKTRDCAWAWRLICPSAAIQTAVRITNPNTWQSSKHDGAIKCRGIAHLGVTREI